MIQHTRKLFNRFRILLFVPPIFLAGCNLSIAADVTPPPGYQMESSTAQETATPTQPLYPILPPDPANGKNIYLEQCGDCHGARGLGDGSRALSLPNPPSAIGSSQLTSLAVPSDWFKIIKMGKMSKNMPAFPNFTDRQIWDTIAYVLSLGVTEEDLELGRALFIEQCSGCHGNDGNGVGALANSLQPQDLTKQDYLSAKSNQDLFNIIRDGTSGEMPAFGEKISEDEIWALTSVIRQFGNQPAEPPDDISANAPPKEESGSLPASPPAQLLDEVERNLVTVTGQITNGSGSKLPKDLSVTLYAFDEMQIVLTDTQRVQEDGSYEFKNQVFAPDQDIIVNTEYQGANYSSDLFPVEDQQTTIDLPINIFESSHDTAGLVVERLHYFFEVLDESTLRVIELYVISNPTQKTIVASGPDQPVLDFYLPPGAENLEIQDSELGDRIVRTNQGLGDTYPIYPGEAAYQMLFSYTLPYKDKLELSNQSILDINALVILVPQNTINVNGIDLQESGIRKVQGIPYQMYMGGSYHKCEQIKLLITTRKSNLFSRLSFGSLQQLSIGLAALGTVLLLIGIWAFQRNSTAHSVQKGDVYQEKFVSETVETLLDAILALDDQYQEQKLPEITYIERRSELKARLRVLSEKKES